MSAVGFDDSLADCQSHARSVDLHTLVSSAVEFFKNERLLKIVDARTAIRNADGERLLIALGFSRDSDRSARRRIFRGVLEQMHQNFLDVSRVHARMRKVGGNSDIHRMLHQE